MTQLKCEVQTINGKQQSAVVGGVHAIIDAINSNTDNFIKAKPIAVAGFSPVGNSITASVDGFWFTFYLNQKGGLTFVENFGVGGNTTELILDRIENISPNTRISTLMEGTNDASQGVTPLQHATNIKELLLILISKGITPIMVLSPVKNNPAHSAAIRAMNLYDYITCKTLGIMCFDPWASISDGNGALVSGSNFDGTHPNSEYHKKHGLILSDMYDIGISSYPFNVDNNTGLIPNSLFMTDTNSDGEPDNWGLFGAGSEANITPTELGVGNTFSFRVVDGFGYTYPSFTLEDNTRYSYGLKFKVQYISKEEGTLGDPIENAVDGKVEIYIQDPSGTRTYIMDNGSQSSEGVISGELTTEQEVGDWRFYITANGSDMDVRVSIAQVTMFSIDEHTV